MNKKVKINFGFTTVELLVAVTILAVLAILVVTVINPIDLLKQGKDSNRVASLNAVNNALRFLTENEPGTFIGTSSVVYVSIPSAVSDCSNLGLPTLPSGWMYGCATSANLRKIDGTGWIPVNFNSLPAGSPISELPVDSKNSTSTRNYFTYVASGSSWELAFAPEAEKNKLGGANNLTIKDGGQKASLFEIGKDLSLLPLDYGDSSLVGYWAFNEGSGALARDYSGYGNNGSVSGSGWTQGIIGGGLDFSQTTGAGVAIPDSNSLDIVDALTISFWAKNISSPATSAQHYIFGKWSGIGDANYTWLWYSAGHASSNRMGPLANRGGVWGVIPGYVVDVPSGVWKLMTVTYEKNGTNKYYINGVVVAQAAGAGALATNSSALNINSGPAGYDMVMDDFRIYNRALSGAEVLAIYNAAK